MSHTPAEWAGGLHDVHCREDRCALGCDCPCHAGWLLRGQDMPLVDLSAEPAGHTHHLEYRGHKQIGEASSSPFIINPARTGLLMQCTECGEPLFVVLAGHWSKTELGL